MTTRADQFLDSNVLVYAFSADPRAARAEELLGEGCTISVQGLNEFANVARRKLGMSWAELREALAALRDLCPVVVPLDMETHSAGIGLAKRYGFSVFDALVVAAALRQGCATLWSEDMQDGLVIDGGLRITNPFTARNASSDAR
jgi:predicted nucleic acid-binding protein